MAARRGRRSKPSWRERAASLAYGIDRDARAPLSFGRSAGTLSRTAAKTAIHTDNLRSTAVQYAWHACIWKEACRYKHKQLNRAVWRLREHSCARVQHAWQPGSHALPELAALQPGGPRKYGSGKRQDCGESACKRHSFDLFQARSCWYDAPLARPCSWGECLVGTCRFGRTTADDLAACSPEPISCRNGAYFVPY